MFVYHKITIVMVGNADDKRSAMNNGIGRLMNFSLERNQFNVTSQNPCMNELNWSQNDISRWIRSETHNSAIIMSRVFVSYIRSTATPDT